MSITINPKFQLGQTVKIKHLTSHETHNLLTVTAFVVRESGLHYICLASDLIRGEVRELFIPQCALLAVTLQDESLKAEAGGAGEGGGKGEGPR